MISILLEDDLNKTLSWEISDLCLRYANKIGINSSALDYKSSANLIVFEHGCPNNTPNILWKQIKGWKALFPNRAISPELWDYFGDNINITRSTEALWQANQPKLALNLLEKIKQKTVLNAQENILLIFLGLKARELTNSNIRFCLLLSQHQFVRTVELAKDMNLILENDLISKLGKAILNYFRQNYDQEKKRTKVENPPEFYYPYQCERELRQFGKKN